MIEEPNFDAPVRPIAELVAEPDFPKSALGAHVDIGGNVGVVVDIVNVSIKVRSREGSISSFNVNGLKKIYGVVEKPVISEASYQAAPPSPLPPSQSEPELEPEPPVPAPSAPQPALPGLVVPDFDAPVRPIAELVMDPEFPKSALGAHVDIGGNVGVVVDIVNVSIKVRSREGSTSSFNVNGLKKIYGVVEKPVVPEASYQAPPPPPPPASSRSEPEPEPEPAPASSFPQPAPRGPIVPDFDTPPRPIAELVVDPDFPKSALGVHVDIGGYPGVVVDIVNLSLKVRSQDGITKSYNANGLKKIYGPVEKPAIPEMSYPPPPPRAVSRDPAPARPAPPPRNIIEQPDFTLPVQDISTLVGRIDFPRCAFGQHVKIADYTGVVVELAGESLKVRSTEDVTRSYNAPVLRKLYGKKA